MKITRISEMLTAIEGYFGAFNNPVVKDIFADELSYIKPSDYDAIFRQIIIKNPSSWKPDIKALTDAIVFLKIETLLSPFTNGRKCPVCFTEWSTTGLCPTCLYNSDKDGTPDEYRAFYNDWKNGKIAKFDWSSIKIKTIANNSE